MSITYNLTQTKEVQINIYTLSGKLIRQILNSQQTAGRHEQQLSTHNLQNGTYIILPVLYQATTHANLA